MKLDKNIKILMIFLLKQKCQKILYKQLNNKKFTKTIKKYVNYFILKINNFNYME